MSNCSMAPGVCRKMETSWRSRLMTFVVCCSGQTTLVRGGRFTALRPVAVRSHRSSLKVAVYAIRHTLTPLASSPASHLDFVGLGDGTFYPRAKFGANISNTVTSKVCLHFRYSMLLHFKTSETEKRSGSKIEAKFPTFHFCKNYG